MLGFGYIGRLLPIRFFTVFFLVLAVFVFVFWQIFRRQRSNSKAPRLTVGARIVAKRQEMRRGSGDSMGHTWYYATFEVQSGDRFELEMEGAEFSLLAEGDAGTLTFQGTRFLGFERI